MLSLKVVASQSFPDAAMDDRIRNCSIGPQAAEAFHPESQKKARGTSIQGPGVTVPSRVRKHCPAIKDEGHIKCRRLSATADKEYLCCHVIWDASSSKCPSMFVNFITLQEAQAYKITISANLVYLVFGFSQ
jgi:hypothetical protein